MKSSVRLTGAARMADRVRRFAEDVQRSQESVLRQQARAACVALGFETMPYGFPSDAPPKFKARVAGDIRRVYASRESIYQLTELIKPRSFKLAMAFWTASKAGKIDRANKYLREAGLRMEVVNPALHKAARVNGEVPRHHVPQVAVQARSLAAYVRGKQATIGTAKAGWYAAAKGLGGRVRSNDRDANGVRSTAEIFPGWIRKIAGKFPGLGGARVSPNRVEIFTNVKHGREAIAAGGVENALEKSNASFLAAMAESLRAKREKYFPGTKAA